MASSSQPLSIRTVVLLRPNEKAKLARIAAREKTSSGEVIRRFIQNGDAWFRNQQQEEVVVASLKIISSAVADTNKSLTHTMDKLDRLHAELAKRDIR